MGTLPQYPHGVFLGNYPVTSGLGIHALQGWLTSDLRMIQSSMRLPLWLQYQLPFRTALVKSTTTEDAILLLSLVGCAALAALIGRHIISRSHSHRMMGSNIRLLHYARDLHT